MSYKDPQCQDLCFSVFPISWDSDAWQWWQELQGTVTVSHFPCEADWALKFSPFPFSRLSEDCQKWASTCHVWLNRVTFSLLILEPSLNFLKVTNERRAEVSFKTSTYLKAPLESSLLMATVLNVKLNQCNRLWRSCLSWFWLTFDWKVEGHYRHLASLRAMPLNLIRWCPCSGHQLPKHPVKTILLSPALINSILC